jgi:hypothetical protein
MISRIIQLKNVFAENHGLVSVIDIVPYSSKPPLKLGCIEMQIGGAYTMVQHQGRIQDLGLGGRE